jgi:hypothetical protein
MYDPPCGPTAWWKISDRVIKPGDTTVLLKDLFPIGKPTLLFAFFFLMLIMVFKSRTMRTGPGLGRRAG